MSILLKINVSYYVLYTVWSVWHYYNIVLEELVGTLIIHILWEFSFYLGKMSTP